jgi:hypothetical protein
MQSPNYATAPIQSWTNVTSPVGREPLPVGTGPVPVRAQWSAVDQSVMKPIFFATPAEWRAWLEQNHADEDEVLVGFHRKASGLPSMTWSESVDQALCFGWIDGVRKGIDETSYSIRFTPRRARSNWSANIKKVERMAEQGLMHPSGLAASRGAPRNVRRPTLKSAPTQTSAASTRGSSAQTRGPGHSGNHSLRATAGPRRGGS